MKKILPIIIIGVLLISGLGAVATPVGDQTYLKTSVSFSQLQVEEKEEHSTVDIRGADSVLLKKDYYMVPSCTKTFTFPFGTEITDITCIPKNIHNQQITKKLMTTPEPVLCNQFTTKEKSQIQSSEPQSLQTWYDYEISSGMINSAERGITVKITLYPVQYQPINNMLEWADSIDIEIQYSEPSQPTFFEDEYSLIILAKQDFEDELDDLVQHKINRGITTKYVSLDDIYSGEYFPVQGRDSAERIKYFIKDAIENWGTSNVLLVGSSANLPSRLTHVYVDVQPDPDDEVFVSDLYYADIYDEFGDFSSWDSNENDIFGEYDWNGQFDEVDLDPDVFLGRLACVNANEVTTCVNKIITYETTEAYTQDWFGDLIVFGGDSFPDDNEIDEGEYLNQAVIDIMDGFVPNKMWASEGDLSGFVPSGVTKMSNAINEGAGFIDFSGHGNTAVWATHAHESFGSWLPTPFGAYYNSDVSTLSNGDELPIVIMGACSVCKYNTDSDCFGWSFLSNPNGGSIATCGATGLGWAYIGTGVTQGLVEGMALNCFRAYKNEGALTFGEMWGKAVSNYLQPGMQATDYKTIEEWQSFGDPTLAIGEESQAPLIPEDLNGPASGKINEEHTYTASTTDPEGDDIYYLFDWGDGEFSGWVGPYDSGNTGLATHTWTEEGDYEIRVKAKDDHGVQSDWSDPLPITMPQSSEYTTPFFLHILEQLMQRFPLLEQILQSRPILSSLLEL